MRKNIVILFVVTVLLAAASVSWVSLEESKAAANPAAYFYMDEGGSGPVIHEGDPCHWTQQGFYTIGVDSHGNIRFLSCNCYVTPVIGLQCWWE